MTCHANAGAAAAAGNILVDADFAAGGKTFDRNFLDGPGAQRLAEARVVNDPTAANMNAVVE
ncbi:MAG TPA: hypothetical protein VM555_01745, partial [Tahibacter sp.]|nr:hypothetical protein [Tahibacter sp.]